MADVNILLPAFGITWAQDGTVATIDEAQWRAGWAFIGAVPPSVEQFNKVMQVQDQKANWLYTQLAFAMVTNGVTPVVNDSNLLNFAMRGRYRGIDVLTTGTGTYTVPAGVTMLEVEIWGGGGGGGGANQAGSAAGGGAGAYCLANIDVVAAGSSLAYTVGAFGVGGNSTPTSGTAGGTTSFGGVMTATGGGGGQLNLGGISTLPGAGGVGSGSSNKLMVVGSGGGQGYQVTGGYTGGLGGSAYKGSISLQNVNSPGVTAVAPGSGGSGAASASSGGSGGPGLIIIRKYA